MLHQMLLISLLFFSLDLRAQTYTCKDLFHVVVHDNKGLQTLAQRALALSEKLAIVPHSPLSVNKAIVHLELWALHRKMLSYFSIPTSHPGPLFVSRYFAPEFYWRTRISMRLGAVQARAPFLTQTQRDSLRILWTPSGVVHASSGELISSPLSGDFVIGLDGQIYIAHQIRNQFPHFRHSSFFAGAPVLFAGYISVEPNGTVAIFSRNSGHYQPSRDHFLWALDYLRDSGFTILSEYPDRFK